MCRYVYSLEKEWPVFANHLGYPHDLVQAIQNHRPGNYDAQIGAFLRYWVFPDCGLYDNIRIIERLKICLENQMRELFCSFGLAAGLSIFQPDYRVTYLKIILILSVMCLQKHFSYSNRQCLSAQSN